MGVVGYRIGRFDAVRQAYPRELFDPETGDLLRPAGRNEPDFLPEAVVIKATSSPQVFRDKFDDIGTIKKDLLDAGRAMFAWLNHGDIGVEWRTRRQADDLTLLDVIAPEENDDPDPVHDLHELPWELLHEGNLPLFGVTSIARFHAGQSVEPPADWPLRIWVINGAPADKAVQAMNEIRHIRAALLWHRHSVDIEIDVPADHPEFAKTLGNFQPHILHFIGHSGVSPTSGMPALFINAAGSWELDATSIATALVNAKFTPRLVFLNACDTADRANAYAVAAAFSGAGVPATLAMQGAVEGAQAGIFSAAVYKRLASEHSDLVDAVRRARTEFDPGKPHHWAYPVLSLSGSAAALLPSPPETVEKRFNDIQACRIFQQVRLFSGRAEERRRLRTAVCPISSNGKPKHLIILVGETQHGKSYLVKRWLECLTLRGHNTQYVEVADTGSKDALTFLLDMLRPSDDGVAWPELEKAFKRFKWEAHQILQRGVSTAWDGVTDVAEPLQFDATNLKSENAQTLLAEAALGAMREAATPDAPLLITLDQFRHDSGELAVSDSVFSNLLWPLVFEPVSFGKVPNVYIGLIFTRDDAEKVYRIQEKISHDQWLRIEDLPAEKFDELVDELFGYLDGDKLEGIDDFARGIKRKLGKGKSTAYWLQYLLKVADDTVHGSLHRTHVGRSR